MTVEIALKKYIKEKGWTTAKIITRSEIVEFTEWYCGEAKGDLIMGYCDECGAPCPMNRIGCLICGG